MESDDVNTLKALRKAKKKEIQAWITAFEDKEGRPPEAKDKEAVRPMYREFRELEAKLAAVSATNPGDGAGSTLEGPNNGEPYEQTVSGAKDGTASVGDSGSMDIAALKKTRDTKKREIKQWVKEFEDREGHAPTTKEKSPIKDLYRDFKDLDRRLAEISGARGGGDDGDAAPITGSSALQPEETVDRDVPADTESIKAEKKRVKHEIQTWLDDFEAREGRAALQEDKATIRPLYKHHKELERELARALAASTAQSESTALSPSASQPDITKGDVDLTSMLLSPSSSAGEMPVTAASPQDEDNDADESTARKDSAVMRAATHEDADVSDENIIEGNGDTGGGSSEVEEQKSWSPTVVEEKRAQTYEEPRAEEGKGVSQTEMLDERRPSKMSPGSEEVKKDSSASLEPVAVSEPNEHEAPSTSALAEQTQPNERASFADDDNRPPPITTGRPSFTAISPDNNDDGEDGGKDDAIPLSSGEEEGYNTGDGGGDGDSGNIPMTAQEARVRRMRARFLDMKDLIEGEESALPSSPTSAGGRSPRQELRFSLADAKQEDASASAAHVKGAKNRWALLGDAIAPNRLSPPSARARARRALNDGADIETADGKEAENNPAAASTAQQYASVDGAGAGTSEQPTADTLMTAPLADDGVSGAWVSGQMSNLLLSDAPPPPPPVPPGLEKLETEASRLGAAVDPPTPGFAAEYQSGVRGAELVVASVGVEEVRARERALELVRLADAREETNVYRAREANLLYREDRARRRVLAYKREIERKVTVEKQAVIEISIAGERALAPAFARARRGLERAIQAQAGRVREVFGELRPRETPGGRRFRVDWKGVPQPVEIRLHCIRAVRDRLPRGSYVMLSSMAERLGGRVTKWRKGADFDDFDDDDSIDTDGGDSRPAATLPVKHGGRYFDRELRLDQNVHQLCPSKSEVRPGNILVFELFRLAGSGEGGGGGGGARCGSIRHKGGELDEDTAVGWCVLPLADSRLRIVRGSFRIPLLRGELNPSIDLHEGLEKLIAADLEAWLGNLYLDIRHLQREARLDGPGPDGGSAVGGEGFDIEYDHVRKVARLGKGLSGTVAPLTGLAGRWQPWTRRKAKAAAVDDGDNDEDSDEDDDNDNDDDDDDDDDDGGGDGRSPNANGDIETGGGSAIRLQSDSGGGADKPLAPLVEGLTEDGADGVKAPKPSSGEEKGTDGVVGNAETKEKVGETSDAGGSKKPKKAAWFGSVKKPKGWIEDALPPSEAQQAKKAKGKRRRKPKAGKRRADGGIEAPRPQGGWASDLLKDEDDDDDGEHVNVDETIDEECLSDDDMPRGKTFRFTPAGEAALAVDTASGSAGAHHGGGNAKGVGLRRRGEGARWDTAALGLGHRGLPKRYSGGNAGARDTHVWTPLTNAAEMEFYRFAVASDPGTDAPPTPAHIIAHKLRYIQQEVLLDLHPRGWRVVEYWLAVMVFIGALWLRVYIHALGQWFMLYSLGVPVFSFSPRLWELAIKYMDRSSSLGVEIAFVWWGPTFVMLCFAAVAALARLWGLAACGGKGGGGGEGVPHTFSRFVAGFGVAAGLDPYLLLVVDFMAGNHGCASKCIDYTSPTCRCHEGDAWKLYVRMDAEEGAGISGALLTIMIYAMVSIATALILHQYLLHAHMNGRMVDVWRRLNADEDNFFVPHDLELSAAELQHACVHARKWRGPNGARREVVFYDFHVNQEDSEQAAGSGGAGATPRSQTGDTGGGRGGSPSSNSAGRGTGSPRGRDARRGKHDGEKTTHVVIFDVSVEGKKSLHRQFLRASDGTILEVFGEAGREVGWQLTFLNALMRQEIGGAAAGSDGADKDQGIFAGMLPAASPLASLAAVPSGKDGEGKDDSSATGVVPTDL